MARQLNSQRLLDLLTRHQIYLEGYKPTFGAMFDRMMVELRKELREIFADVPHGKMSEFTKRELEAFIKRLLRAQGKHYSLYTDNVIKELRAFIEVDATVHLAVVEDVKPERKNRIAALLLLYGGRKGISALWTQITGSVVPATGTTPEASLARFAAASAFAIESVVRRARAENREVREALFALFGTPTLNNRDGQLPKFSYQASALTATLVQHATQIVQAAVMAEFFPRYRWSSIIDDRTTSICRERDGKIWAYGEGPLPPAHIRCRSVIEPLADDTADAPPSTFASWLRGQPKDVQDDVGTDGTGFKPKRTLTLAQFKAKLSTLLKR